MKKLLYLATIMTMILTLAAMSLPAEAAKAQREVGGQMVYVGNGYPSGPHFNLHFLAKWLDTFICPTAAEYESETQDKNVIYVPRGPDRDIGVLVESGRRGPKNSIDPMVFEVTDWCSSDFPDPENDDAAVRLPPDPVGYLVYARITGKPLDDAGNSYFANLGGCLKYAEDFTGNNLILLGLVSSDGDSYVPTCDGSDTPGDTIPLMRTDGSHGKGVKKATNITPIFLWSGDVCDIVATVGESTDAFCCVDADTSGDGVYEHCDSLADLISADPTLTECPAFHTHDGMSSDYYNMPYSTVYASCSEYTNEWVFNVADFVDYLWSVDSSGAYNISVRFYPCSELPSGACGEIGN
jgi:hypothetical protein